MAKLLTLLFSTIYLASCSPGPETSSSAITGKEDSKSMKPVASEIESQESKKTAASFYQQMPLFEGKLNIAIPASFALMPTERVILKYPNSGNRPEIVFTNDATTVNLAFTNIAMPTSKEDLPDVKKALSQQLQSTHPIDFQSRIENINGSDYVIFEFESQAADSRIYNLMFATDIDDKLLLGTFNCTEALKDEWQPRAKEILLSIRKG